MSHIEEVKSLDSTHTEWRARLPMGMGTFRWKAEVVEEQPDERLVWQSLPGSDVENMGEVIFRDAPGNRGTEIMVNMAYQPPGGKLGEIAAAIANPAFSKVIREDIRRFKSLTEAGEIPTIEGQPTGI